MMIKGELVLEGSVMEKWKDSQARNISNVACRLSVSQLSSQLKHTSDILFYPVDSVCRVIEYSLHLNNY